MHPIILWLSFAGQRLRLRWTQLWCAHQVVRVGTLCNVDAGHGTDRHALEVVEPICLKCGTRGRPVVIERRPVVAVAGKPATQAQRLASVGRAR
jgi:hypothetical protein